MKYAHCNFKFLKNYNQTRSNTFVGTSNEGMKIKYYSTRVKIKQKKFILGVKWQ